MWNTVLFMLITYLIFYIRRKYSYWERKGVPSPKAWPLVGNMLQIFTQQKTVGEIFNQIYRNYDNYPVVGAYHSGEPVLIVRDPEFINTIIDKQSEYFSESSQLRIHSQTADCIRGKTEGLYPLIEQGNRRLLSYLRSRTADGNPIETQDFCRRYTLYNVALAGFGTDVRCFDSDETDFMKLANSFIAPETFASSMLWQMVPQITNLISPKSKVEEKLVSIIINILEHREDQQIVVNDYLQFISEPRQKKLPSHTEIAAHAASFLEDGYERSALVMSHVLFNLAKNWRAQVKVKTEIEGLTCPQDLEKATFLNACIYESIRLCPLLKYRKRICNTPYSYVTSKRAPKHLKKIAVDIDKGTACIIPVDGLCRDEHHFLEPELFKPERFCDKDNNGFEGLFYPFAIGHRNCPGQQFGMWLVQIGVSTILQNYELNIDAPSGRYPNKAADHIWIRFRKNLNQAANSGNVSQ